MIESLYEKFRHWSAKGSVYVCSDSHFEDEDYIKNPKKRKEIANQYSENICKTAHKTDTLIHLGDVGNPEYLKKCKAYKVLVMGNHDSVSDYADLFDEIYDGPLFISPKILLSHEAIPGLTWCVNIHGHDHEGEMRYYDSLGGKHLNVAGNVCGWKVINLGEEIKKGLTSKTKDIHRITIDKAIVRAAKRDRKKTPPKT